MPEVLISSLQLILGQSSGQLPSNLHHSLTQSLSRSFSEHLLCARPGSTLCIGILSQSDLDSPSGSS